MKLKGSNRWMVMAKRIPWDEFEGAYSDSFADSG